MKTKHLDPGYTAGGNADLESLNYSFNLHNQITGINKDYALKSAGNYSKWGHFFGLYLGYDNRDNVFTSSNLNGQVTGAQWSTQGDDAQRRYNYSYDNAGRLVNAAFSEQKHSGDGWASNLMDFSVSGTGGKITYDLNGNLLNMLQKGVIPGTAAPVTIDELTYSYGSYSNKLASVTDQMTSTAVNGSFGDIKDGSNGATADYVFDANGNVVVDLNKNVQSVNGGAAGSNGIVYNFLDKPELIRIVGKGTIKIVYNADGEKLQRAFIPESGGASSITTYINGFTYQETATITASTPPPLGGAAASLSFINFEDGRIRVVSPAAQDNGLDKIAVDGNIDLPGGKRGAYDFFVMDYQQNVRMILTEETHISANTATMEGNRSGLEESIFGQTGAGNEVAATRYNKPAGWTGNTSSSVSRIGTNSGHNIGPNTLQKVMAGDKITASVQYYYASSASGNNPDFLSAAVSSLLSAITGGNAAGALVKNNATPITDQLNVLPAFMNVVQPGGTNPGGTTPQAYLTIIFFDERFNFISAADGGVAQQQVASSVGAAGLLLNPGTIKAPKNGYVYVYVSNQSNQDVFFDNLNVNIATGNIIEENHYYAYGLKIAGISSKKLGDTYEGVLKNSYLYQGEYSEFDDDVSWNDFELRNYDPQIGKWIQQDPFNQFASAYQSMGNDPITNIDPSGGDITSGIFAGLSQFGRVAVTTLGGALIGGFIDLVSGGDGKKGLLIGASIGLASNIHFDVKSVGQAFKGAGQFLDMKQKLEAEKAWGYYYKSADAAAIGFGKQYNASSIRLNREFGSVIFKVKIKKLYWYSYNTPLIGGALATNFNRSLPKGAVQSTLIHTHGGFMDPNGDNNFSPKDQRQQSDEGIDSYVALPNGKLRVLREGKNYMDKYGDPICDCLSADVRYGDDMDPKTRGMIYLENFENPSNRDITPNNIFDLPLDTKF